MKEALCPNCFGRLGNNRTACAYCGFDLTASDHVQYALQPFTVLNNRYMLGRTLGAGGFGITYIAYDTNTGSRVAVKEYFPNAICIRNTAEQVEPQRYHDAYEAGKQKFYNEANLLASLRNCPCVVRVADFFYENNTAYIVMEYIDGITLKKYVKNHGDRIDFETARSMVIDVAMSLAQVHSLNVLHRDISPDNIMVCKNGQVKLIDFGASRDYVNNRSGGLSVILKPGYAPPEQYSKVNPQGPYTDVYALACTFYRIVSGINVPDANDRLSGRQIPTLKELVPEVPQNVSDAIDKALQLRYKQRTQDMIGFICDLTNDTTVPPLPKQSHSSGTLNVYYGNRVVASFEIADGVDYVVGRSSQTCNILVKNDMRVSRSHCRIRYNASRGTVTVTDLSTYGTFLIEGGQYLPRNIPTEFATDITLQLSSSDVFLGILR